MTSTISEAIHETYGLSRRHTLLSARCRNSVYLLSARNVELSRARRAASAFRRRLRARRKTIPTFYLVAIRGAEERGTEMLPARMLYCTVYGAINRKNAAGEKFSP